MIKYLHKILTRFSEYGKLVNSVVTPSLDHLFQIRNKKEAQLPSEEISQEFHHVVAQLLFLCNHTWQDNQTVVASLATRVENLTRTIVGK